MKRNTRQCRGSTRRVLILCASIELAGRSTGVKLVVAR
jgi:hypothetical protein